MAWRHSLQLRFELEEERGGGCERWGDQDECAQRHARRRAFSFEKDGTTIDCLPLEAFIGRALVIDLAPRFSTGAQPGEISIADLEPFARDLTEAPRLLLKTSEGRDTAIFPTSSPVLARDVPVWLKARGVILIGMDLPSVDTIDSKDLSNHRALVRAGIAIDENLDLAGIKAGRYDFVALPLKIIGGDAAPVRAILWRD